MVRLLAPTKSKPHSQYAIITAPERFWQLKGYLAPPSTAPCMWVGKASLQRDVALYTKGTVHHTAPLVRCRPRQGSSHFTLEHPP
jgi:hypothetical protein